MSFNKFNNRFININFRSSKENYLGNHKNKKMKGGIDINRQDENGDTLLHIATRKGDKNEVFRLVDIGAKFDICNKKGEAVRKTSNFDMEYQMYKKDQVIFMKKPEPDMLLDKIIPIELPLIEPLPKIISPSESISELTIVNDPSVNINKNLYDANDTKIDTTNIFNESLNSELSDITTSPTSPTSLTITNDISNINKESVNIPSNQQPINNIPNNVFTNTEENINQLQNTLTQANKQLGGNRSIHGSRIIVEDIDITQVGGLKYNKMMKRNNEASKLHQQSLENIKKVMKVDDLDARVIKAILYKNINPEISNLEKAKLLVKESTKEGINNIKKLIKKHGPEIKKYLEEKQKSS
jgi:hypothetical protein